MTAKKTRALEALLTAATLTEAAEQANIGVSTLRNWRRTDTEFRDAYKQATDEIVERVTRKAQLVAGLAVATLEEIMSDETAPPQARVAAADKVLGYALKFGEQTDVLNRVAELEKTMLDEGTR